MGDLNGTTIIYVWQSFYPWDVRADKICRSLVAAGANVILLARSEANKNTEEEYHGYRIRRVGLKGWQNWISLPIPWNPFWYFTLRKITKESRPDILIAREIMLVDLASWVAKEFNIPIFIDMAEHYPEAMRSWRKYAKSFFLRLLVHKLKIPDWVEKRAVRKVTGVITVCEENSIRLNHEYSIPLENCIVVTNTPETETIDDAVKKMKIQKIPRKVFGYHGIVVGDRDLETVIKGFEIAAQTDPEIELIIAGGGESLNSLYNIAECSNVKSRIHLTGSYKQEQLSQLLDKFDYGIAPWKVNAFTQVTIANKFFEYALYGKPFIYASTNPMNRLMKDFNCGLSYENANPSSVAFAMLEILKLDREKMVSNGRKAILNKYNWPNDFLKLANLIKNNITVSKTTDTRNTSINQIFN